MPSNDEHVNDKESKPSLADAWAARMAKSSATPQQKKDATKLLIKLLRQRRTWQEAQAAIEQAKSGKSNDMSLDTDNDNPVAKSTTAEGKDNKKTQSPIIPRSSGISTNNQSEVQSMNKIGGVVRAKDIGSNIIVAAIFILILFFSVKSWFVTLWEPPKQPVTYAIRADDGRYLSIILLPNREALLLYADDKSQSVEVALTEMRGALGTHYFWRLWSIGGPGITWGPLGFRIYPDGAIPVVMEITIINKFTHGTAETALPKKGGRTHPLILFTEDAIRFENMWLTKEPTDNAVLQNILLRLKQ